MARPPSPIPLRHDLRAELVPVAALVPWDRNPRINDAASKRLARTIEAHGWTTPLLVQRSSSRVVAGHTRLKAAAILGLTEVPVVWLDVDDRRATEIALADNRLAELAEWEDDGLAALLRELADDGADLDLLGWTDGEMDALIAGVSVPTSDEWGEGLGGLPVDDRLPFRQMTFTVHDEQFEQVDLALRAAKAAGPFDSKNQNSNGNALARLAETFLTVRT